jgi:hypothetical protein
VFRITILAVLIVSAATLVAQQPDAAQIAADIAASYYHPDDLASIDCGVKVDLAGLMRQLGRPVPSQTEDFLKSTKIRVHAVRGQVARAEVIWPDAAFPGDKEQAERGIQQMVSGFFQIYWQIFGSSLAPKPHDKFKVVERSGGGYVLQSTEDSENAAIEIDIDHLPIKVRFERPAIKFAASLDFSMPTAPGGLRRLMSVDFSQESGTTVVNGLISTDYQTADGFNIPRHVTIGVGGAFTVTLELNGCSATAGKM